MANTGNERSHLSKGRLTLPAMTLTAQELDELIAELASQRAQMQPPVPRALPSSLESDVPDTPTVDDPNAEIFSFQTEDGLTPGIALRHPGFGWLNFALSAAYAADIARCLLQLASADDVRHRPSSRRRSGLTH